MSLGYFENREDETKHFAVSRTFRQMTTVCDGEGGEGDLFRDDSRHLRRPSTVDWETADDNPQQFVVQF